MQDYLLFRFQMRHNHSMLLQNLFEAEPFPPKRIAEAVVP
jgi:hypothetical protein